MKTSWRRLAAPVCVYRYMYMYMYIDMYVCIEEDDNVHSPESLRLLHQANAKAKANCGSFLSDQRTVTLS